MESLLTLVYYDQQQERQVLHYYGHYFSKTRRVSELNVQDVYSGDRVETEFIIPQLNFEATLHNGDVMLTLPDGRQYRIIEISPFSGYGLAVTRFKGLQI